MNFLITLSILILLVSSCANSNTKSTTTDKNFTAKSKVGLLDAWEQSLPLMVKNCAAFEPPGDQRRRQVYELWLAQNDAKLKKADLLIKQVVPMLTPTAGVDPVKLIKANTAMVLSGDFYVLSAGEKIKTCKDFEIKADSYSADNRIDESIQYLEKWLTTSGRTHKS